MDAAKIAGSLTEPQSRALHDALYVGACKRHDENRAETRRQWCTLKNYGHSSVRPNVLQKLNSLGLIAKDSHNWNWILSAKGMRVARHIWGEWLAEYEERSEEQAPTTVEEYVASVRDAAANREREYFDRVKKAKRLWRGMRLASENLVDRPNGDGHYWTTAVSSSIADAFDDADRSYRSKLTLSLDDLIALGEQIEALR